MGNKPLKVDRYPDNVQDLCRVLFPLLERIAERLRQIEEKLTASDASESVERCRSCGKPPDKHDDDCINHAGQFGYTSDASAEL